MDQGTTTVPGRRNEAAVVVNDGNCCGLWAVAAMHFVQ
jgi:hypothetical protein